MAEKKKNTEEKKQEKLEKKIEKRKEDERAEILVRIFGYDLVGSKNIYTGLTRIKGISWTIANAICLKLGLDRNKKVSELTKQDINKIEDFLEKLDVYDFLKNRRADPTTGKTGHLYSTDLDISKEFDIKRLKKMRSWKGLRHATGQPVRGQRTRSHFRSRDRAKGIKIKRKPVEKTTGAAKW